ncbi:MAG TPA: thioesterase family protein [Bacteroidia bacterium]|nr:thioesterase family protein [Bacteroidia bacterium]HRH08278.1 thioesterase family protein [Bacteroidia bacterium]HRH64408.1 thioesterase family protein [Bacteroidia bacterium]
MFTSTTQIRVRYAETDKMGYVYYGNYAQYYEVGRVEGLRDLGLSYRTMEEEGILLPVLDYQIKYFKPAYYDDLLTIRTTILELKGARIFFEYETLNQQGELLNKGTTTLVFVSAATSKPCAPPDWFMQKLDAQKG